MDFDPGCIINSENSTIVNNQHVLKRHLTKAFVWDVWMENKYMKRWSIS